MRRRDRGATSAAKSPAILVDADRFGVASELMGLAEKMQIPMAVINTAKSVIDETFPYYLGIYIGKPSEPSWTRATLLSR